MCRWSRLKFAPNFRNRAGSLSALAVGVLSFALRGRAGLHELPVGLSTFGSRLSQHLPGTGSLPPIETLSRSPFSLGAFSSPLALIPPHAHVRCGEAYQWRRVVVESDRTPLSL